MHLLYKLCKDCKKLPTSYTLQQGSLSVGAIRSYGGFADVNIGDYLGSRVAIKRLRFWAEDVPNRVFKVLESLPTLHFTVIHFANSGFVRKSSSGSVFPILTSCRCWGFRSPRASTLSSWSPLGCKMGTLWSTPGPTQAQTVCSW